MHFLDATEEAFYNAALSGANRSPMALAIDLDDTLIHTVPREDAPNFGHSISKPNPSFDSFPLTLVEYAWWSVPQRLKNTRPGWKLRSWINKEKANTLEEHPITYVSPGMVGFLLGLRDLGHTLILVTASRRPRVEFLLQYLPVLRCLFSQRHGRSRIFCSEELELSIAQVIACNSARDETLPKRGAAALYHKTPMVLKTLWPEGIDLLVDDSEDTRNALLKQGEGSFLLPISQERLNSIQVAAHFGCPLTALPSNLADLPTDYQWSHVADPLFFPLAHRSLDLHFA